MALEVVLAVRCVLEEEIPNGFFPRQILFEFLRFSLISPFVVFLYY